MIATTAKMGTYRLRVAATDESGRAGAVDSTLDVRLAGDGPLQLSSLVLGVSDEGRFAGRLQFQDEQTAVAYLEIYGVPKGTLSAELSPNRRHLLVHALHVDGGEQGAAALVAGIKQRYEQPLIRIFEGAPQR